MTPFIKQISNDLLQQQSEVVKVTTVNTLYVDDALEHDHDVHNHDHGCSCDHDCDCDQGCDQDAQITTDPMVLPDNHVSSATVLGHSYDWSPAKMQAYDTPLKIEIPTQQPATIYEAFGVSSEGAMQSGYTSGGNAADSFNIMITYGGDLSGSLAQSFMDAADYFSQIILKDVADLSSGLDDIQIDASLIEIDGAGGVLGRAGPQYVRSSNYLPTEAIMEFDVADAQTFADQGLWDDIVFHEMLHTLGFGTLWGFMSLRDGSIAGGDMRFNGTHANDVYEDEFADIAAADGFNFGIPIETDGGAGTAGGHWDEATFDNEIMTGYVNGSNFMSWMSIAALEDMGYDTVYDNPYDANDAFGSAPAGDPLMIV